MTEETKTEQLERLRRVLQQAVEEHERSKISHGGYYLGAAQEAERRIARLRRQINELEQEIESGDEE